MEKLKLRDTTAGRITDLREANGLSQGDFGKAVHVTRPAVRAWEKGRTPNGAQIRAIAERFGVTTDWLLCVPGAPIRAAQWRSDSALADDVSAHVAAAVASRVGLRSEDLSADGEGLLAWCAEKAASDFQSAASELSRVSLQREGMLRATSIVEALGEELPRVLPDADMHVLTNELAYVHECLLSGMLDGPEKSRFVWFRVEEPQNGHDPWCRCPECVGHREREARRWSYLYGGYDDPRTWVFQKLSFLRQELQRLPTPNKAAKDATTRQKRDRRARSGKP